MEDHIATLEDELKGRSAIITGASRGIGAATARDLARHGVSVVLVARSTAQIDALADEINTSGGRAIAESCDVANFDAMTRVAATCAAAFGPADILVNNAGLIDPIARLAESDPDGWNQVIDVNVKGVYHGARAVLPAMLQRGSGTIINVSSGAATGVLEGWSHYCASKAAVLSMTRCLHKEYGDKGIRTLGMSPGTVATDMQVQIKASGINPVSQLDPNVHIPPAWPARAITWLCTTASDDYLGQDFSLKTPEGRAALNLPPPG